MAIPDPVAIDDVPPVRRRPPFRLALPTRPIDHVAPRLQPPVKHVVAMRPAVTHAVLPHLAPAHAALAHPPVLRPPTAAALPPRPPLVAALPARLPGPLHEVLFHLKQPYGADAATAIARAYGLQPIRSERSALLGTTLYRMAIADRGRAVGDVVRVLRADARIALVAPNDKYTLQGEFGPAHANGLQWTADRLHLDALHGISRGEGVLVALLDTGVDESHPELKGLSIQRLDMLNTPFRPNAHGTAMAGVILAHTQLTGVAPGVRLMAIRVLDSEALDPSAAGTSMHVIDGLNAAFEAHAKIVNMSFAGPDNAELAEHIKLARQQGIIIVAAAGNAGPLADPLYPGADPNAIAVSATDSHDRLYRFANRGPYIRIAAPGVDTLEPTLGKAYQMTSGTSVAAAHVSGIVALMLARSPKLDMAAVRDMLTTTAEPLPDEVSGPGIVNALTILRKLNRQAAADLSAPTR